MSIVSCTSCGMQYNAAGYKPGVQFKCTQCGAMVIIAGPVRGTGRLGGPRRAIGGPPGPQQAGQPGMPVYGPPRSSNTGTYVVIGVGVALAVGVIIAVIVLAGKPSPQQLHDEKMRVALEEERKRQREEDDKKRARNAALNTPLNAALEYGPRIEALMRAGDRAGLEALFDWNTYAAYNASLVARSKDYLASPLFSTGEHQWVKPEGGTESLKWISQNLHTSDTLRTAVMDYIQTHCFGAPEIVYEEQRTEKKEAGFAGVVISGRTYVGKFIFIRVKAAGKNKQFWVGAPEGDADVRVINFRDDSATTNMATLVVAREREARLENPDDDRGLSGGFDERAKRDSGLERVADSSKEGEASAAPEGPLPDLAKTGANVSSAQMSNVLRHLVGGGRLALAQKNAISSVNPLSERKAMLGAIIDVLIDAHAAGKRLEKHTLSDALYQVWSNHARGQEYGSEDMVYSADGQKQVTTDLPIRRWLKVYNAYET